MDSGQARSPGADGKGARKVAGGAARKQKPAPRKPGGKLGARDAGTSGGQRPAAKRPTAARRADTDRAAADAADAADRRSASYRRATARARERAAGRTAEPAGRDADAGHDVALMDGAGNDAVERTAAVLAGVGQDAPASRATFGALGKLVDLPADRYLDREESWLRFGQRVLELAEDPNVPLLERVRFESIFASALDEFFMVRVAGRIRRMATGLPVESVSGKAPDQILENTLDMARQLADRHAQCFSDHLLPALAESGIEILRWKELLPDEQARLQKLFRERIYPVLTPLAVDPAHPFPFISGLSLSLAVMVADPRSGLTLFARVKVPPLLPRFLAA